MCFASCVQLAAIMAAAAIGGAVMAMWPNLFDNFAHPVVPPKSEGVALSTRQADDPLAAARQRMLDRHLRHRGIDDVNVLAAMERVARERFVPDESRDLAYGDHPLPIGLGQTISQPYIVALMTQLARPTLRSRILEIGVGSGYQAAVLAEVCREVYSIEILPELADAASKRLASLGYTNVEVRCGDGYRGWPEHAPYDAIFGDGRARARAPGVDRATRGRRPIDYSRRPGLSGAAVDRKMRRRFTETRIGHSGVVRADDRRSGARDRITVARRMPSTIPLPN